MNINDSFEIRPIAHIRTGFSSKFGIPRQGGIVSDLCGKIVFEKEYSSPDWTRGLEDFSHIWVLWIFSENVNRKTGATVRPPKLGGNIRMGVFATRSPFRPNFIGMSVLELERIEHSEEGTLLYVKGADMLDGTPIIDIKPYLPVSDCVCDATSGFSGDMSYEKVGVTLDVAFADGVLEVFPSEHRDELRGILSQDPRPSYIPDGDREYSFEFYGYNIKFHVIDGRVFVSSILKLT